MEFCAGGELFYHLKRLKRMSENEARVYFLELCLGIKHLHEKFIVYRDIKPENILLDINGHIKIADFGLAKPDMNIHRRAHSFCGSPEYMAPEMLQKKGHDYAVDYYCLGAILYELVVGSPPFYTTHTAEMFERILLEDISFPDDYDLSNEVIDLITNLLIKDPKYRRGSMGGVKEILAHPWCKKTPIKDIEAMNVEPPIKPSFFEFYVDEVSDDGEMDKKMKDIYNEAFDDLTEEDEKEKVFKEFYYESDKFSSNFPILEQQQTSSIKNASHKQKNMLCFSSEFPNKFKEYVEKEDKPHEIGNKNHTKKKLSDNMPISKILQQPSSPNGAYFIADQYRGAKKTPDVARIYSSLLKTQKSADFKMMTTVQKVKF